LLAFAAEAGAFAALGGRHVAVAGVGITPAQAGLQLAGQRPGSWRRIDQRIRSRFVMTFRMFFVAASGQIRMAADMG
jgi:hypothetical protein